MKKAAFLMIATLASCNQPATLQVSDVAGVFEFDGCPTIRISNSMIKAGKESLQFSIVNIKGDQYLRTPKSIYVSYAGACYIKYGDVPSIIGIELDGGVVRGITIPDLEGKQSLLFAKKK